MDTDVLSHYILCCPACITWLLPDHTHLKSETAFSSVMPTTTHNTAQYHNSQDCTVSQLTILQSEPSIMSEHENL